MTPKLVYSDQPIHLLEEVGMKDGPPTEKMLFLSWLVCETEIL